MLNPNSQNNFPRPYSQPGFSPPNSPYVSYKPKRRRGFLGCFVLLLIVLGFCAISGVVGNIQSHPSSILFQGDFPFQNVLVVVSVLISVAFVLLLLLLRARGGYGGSLGKTGMRVVALLFFFVFTSIMFWSFFVNPNIGMTRTGFIRTSTVDITVGNAAYFRNPDNGVMQTLCVGRDQDCQAGKGDPSQLDNGLVIQPGQTVSVVFDTVGTYQITSKTTPHMNITIDVSPPPDPNPNNGV